MQHNAIIEIIACEVFGCSAITPVLVVKRALIGFIQVNIRLRCHALDHINELVIKIKVSVFDHPNGYGVSVRGGEIDMRVFGQIGQQFIAAAFGELIGNFVESVK